MTPVKILAGFGIVAILVTVPSIADAQVRGRATERHAVPRVGPPPPVGRPGGAVPSRPYPYRYGPYYYPYRYGPYYPYYGYGYGYPYYYGSGFNFGFSFGYGYPAYGPWAYPYASFGYPYPAYPAYGYAGRPYGGVRIDLPQRDAEVYVDGYFAGVVDNYDGNMQQLNLEPGAHRIEVRAPGFQSASFEINAEPGKTITYRSALRPAQP